MEHVGGRDQKLLKCASCAQVEEEDRIQIVGANNEVAMGSDTESMGLNKYCCGSDAFVMVPAVGWGLDCGVGV